MKRIAILVAVSQELGPLSRLLRSRAAAPTGLQCARSLTGARGSCALLLAETGVGSKCSGRAAASVIQKWKPDALIMAGVGGSLSPELGIGDLVVATSVITEIGTFQPNVELPRQPGSRSAPVHSGPLLSLDRVLITAAEKRHASASAASGRPLAVEMETAGMLHAANLQKTPWAAVRAVSDTCEETLPLDFNRLRSPDGDLPTSRVALAAISRPAAIPGLIRLGKNTTLAAESVATFLAEWLDEIAEKY